MQWIDDGLDVLNSIPSRLLGLVIRLGIADVFWRSGQTKVSGWHVTDTTVDALIRRRFA